METTTQIRTASTLTALIGLWMMISPLYITMTDSALISALVAGALFIMLGVAQMVVKSSLPSMLAVVVALWVVVSAFVLSYSTEGMWSVVLSGIAAFFIGVWDGVEAGVASDEYVPPTTNVMSR